jgi:hypothetical protein
VAVRLADLPQYTIESVAETDGVQRLSGRFSHVRGLRTGRGWLYNSAADSIAVDLEVLDSINGHAVVSVVGSDRTVAEGDRFPWLDGFWRPHHVAMVVEPDHVWSAAEFVATPARFFMLAGVRGWQRADAPLPDGATELEIRPAAWDHEHCEICQAKIGVGGEPAGFRDTEDRWLCRDCHDRFVMLRDLSFLVDA